MFIYKTKKNLARTDEILMKNAYFFDYATSVQVLGLCFVDYNFYYKAVRTAISNSKQFLIEDKSSL